MTNRDVASIIIDNYNYGRFLREAIESALDQTHPRTEVIVVDDGSTDQSHTIMRAYGSRIRTILKTNGGQSSAFNAGFRLSQGQIICFLDSDDVLEPHTVESAVDLFRDSRVVKVHWPLWEIDRVGRKTGGRRPAAVLAKGDLRNRVLANGPGHYLTSPSSARAYARSFLEQVFPLPEIDKELGVGAADWDDYLSMLAPLFGQIESLAQPSGGYRIHGDNDYVSKSFAEKLQRELRLEQVRHTALSRFCERLGYPINQTEWRKQSWYYRLERAVLVIQTQIPTGARLALADQGVWDTDDTFAGCRRVPFPDDYYPLDSAFAIREVERLRQTGITWLVIAWPAFWWLAYYADFAIHLRSNYRVAIARPEVVIFELRRK